MENKDILVAMWDYLDHLNDLTYYENPKNWLNAEGWAEKLEVDISPRRIGNMYRKGLLKRYRNKRWCKDTRYHYFPVRRPDEI